MSATDEQSKQTNELKEKIEAAKQATVNMAPRNDQGNNPTLTQYQEKGSFVERNTETAMINKQAGTSIALRKDGQVNITASPFSQYKMNPNGINTEVSIESGLITNRRNITTDEVIINDHKLNNAVFELTDMKSVKLPGSADPYIIGNFTMYGSVLVKAWEPNLKRYMLIRRPCRMPLFSPKLNLPEINAALGINDPLKVTESIYAYDTEKGYQVNVAAKDSKSYIKDANGDGFVDAGEDREGIDRNHKNVIGANMGGSGGGTAAGGGGFTGSAGVVNTATVESIFQALRKVGYSDSAACGIMGNMMQECSMDPTSGSSGKAYAIGLCQWGYGCDGGRGDKMIAWAQSSGKDPWNAGTQIDWMMKEVSESYHTCSPSAMNSMSATDACTRFCTDFEAPGEPMLENRIKYANEYYNQFKGK